MRINRYLQAAIFSLTTIFAVAQNAKEDFKKINVAYKSGSFSADIVYELYEHSTAARPFETENGRVMRQGENLYMKVSEIEMIKNPSYSLRVDHQDKTIVLLPSTQKAKEEDLMSMDFEKLLQQCKKVEFTKGTKVSTYSLELPEGGEFKSIKISFSNKKYLIEKLEFIYSHEMNLEGKENGPKDRPKMVVLYSNIGNEPKSDRNYFTYNDYLKKVNGKLVLQEKYKDYGFINQLEKK